MTPSSGSKPLGELRDAADTAKAYAYAKGLAAIGAPPGAATALCVSRRGDGFPEALSGILDPRDLAVLEHDVEAGDRPAIGDGAYDLIVASGILGSGNLADAVETMRRLAGALASGGRLALVIDTYATRSREPGVGRDDVILFPELAHLGYLGDEAQRRTTLTPAGWLSLIDGLGLSVEAIAGYGEEPPEPATLTHHAERLAPFDEDEIGTGALLVLAVRDGPRA